MDDPLARRQVAADRAQVRDQDAPSNPPPEPLLAVVPATSEVAAPLEHADASFRSGSEPLAASEPTLALVSLALFGLLASLGKAYSLYPQLRG